MDNNFLASELMIPYNKYIHHSLQCLQSQDVRAVRRIIYYIVALCVLLV